jgi:TolB-like protein/DNA-binding winged helix-turn-helix (wHTH) protein/Tfp pilus assembly protein PilF
MRVAFGEYQLDTETRTLQREGRRILVQSRAFDLLAYLIERRERVVCSDELLDALWPGLHVTPAALSTAVQKARQAVGDDGEHQALIHTEHGRGFRFVAEVTDLAGSEEAQSKPASARIPVAAVAGITAVLLAVSVIWLSQRQTTDPNRNHSLAVLRFSNMSQDPAAEPFTAGIYDDVITQISKVRGLRVIARSSAEQLDPNLDLQEIGRKLSVDVILEGGVQWAGNRIRVNLQLVDCKTGIHLWAETYDRELTAANIFGIQSDIATSVARALQVALSSEERGRLEIVPTENSEAYWAYLLGNHRLTEQTMPAVAAAIEYFGKATELDPKFALAYVGLADGYMFQAISGLSTQELLAKAHSAVDEALELDDRSGEAHAALGSVRWLENDFAGAETAFQRALALSPNSAKVYLSYGEMLAGFSGARYEEALSLSQKAVELDPLSIAAILNVGSCLQRLGRHAEALVWYQRALEIDPDHADTLFNIGTFYWLIAGRLDEAVVWLRKTCAVDPNPSNLAILGWLVLELGDTDEAEHWISRAYEMGPENYYPTAAMQALALYRGDDAAALAYGEKVYEIWPRELLALVFLRDRDVRLGRYAEARARYEEHYPELLIDEDPRVDRHNFFQAIDLALILDKTGDPEQAELLRERSLQEFRSRPHGGGYRGKEIEDVQIYAQRGEKRKALLALRQAIDQGWRVGWWRWLKHKPDLEPLYDEPEYQAMLKEIEADMAAQLAHMREMERNGELAPIPEMSAEAL